MCRKKISASEQLELFIEQGIKPFEPLEDNRPIYNITANYSADNVIYQDSEGNYRWLRAHWGLIPFWTKSKSDAQANGNSMVNARAETIYERPAYKNLVAANRCIIPGTFYEYHHVLRKGKDFSIPFYISDKNCKGFGIAGLHTSWVDKETGEIIPSFTMITTRANELMERIHNHGDNKHRMPLILEPQMFREWLDPATPKERVDEILAYRVPSEKMAAWPVNKIGRNTIDGPEMIERVAYPEIDWA